MLIVFFFAQYVFASPNSLTFQAKIVKPNQVNLEEPSVFFKFQYTDAQGLCVVYEEEFSSVDMTGSKGLVSLELGAGVKTYPPAAITMYDVFNFGTALSCQGAIPTPTVTPTAVERRKVIVKFNDGSGLQTLPIMNLNAVPFALHSTMANNSNQLGGLAVSQFAKYSDITAAGCVAGQALRYTGVAFVCENITGAGVATVSATAPILSSGGANPNISIPKATGAASGYLGSSDWSIFNSKLSNFSTMTSADVTTALTFTPLNRASNLSDLASSSAARTNLGLGTAATLNVAASGDATATEVVKGDDSRLTGAVQTSSSLSGDVTGTINATVVATVGGVSAASIATGANLANNSTSANTASAIVRRNASGDFTAGVINATTFSGTNSSAINVSTQNVYLYDSVNTDRILFRAPTSGITNYTLTLPAAVGTNGQVLSTNASGDLSWINAAVGGVSTVTATAPLVSSGGASPDISLAKASGTVDGYLASSDFSVFNSKLSSATVFSGDISGTSSSISVDKIKGQGLALGAITAGNYLRNNGTNWVNSDMVSADITNSLGYVPANPNVLANYLPLAGGTMSGDLNMGTGLLRLPATTASAGIIMQGTERFIHTFGSNNFFAGSESGNFTLVGLNNIGVGFQTLRDLTSGDHNTAMGDRAGTHITTGDWNSIYGQSAGYNTVDGNSNSFFGRNAGEGNTSGSQNSFFGRLAGFANTTGSNNTFIGMNAGHTDGTIATGAALTNVTAIGYNAQVTASNSLILGGSGSYAVKVGIGNTAPSSVLDVSGDFTLRGTAAPGLAPANQARIYADSTGVLKVSQSGGAYVNLIGAGSVTGVTASLPLVSSGGASPDISMARSTASVDGYLASSDFSMFNNKLGTATAFSGDVTGTYNATVLANSGVTAGSYSGGVTVDVKGRVITGVASLDLTNSVAGVLPIANGGTNASAFTNTYGVGYFDGTRLVTSPVGAANQMLVQTVAGPIWTTATYPSVTTANQLLYSSANNTVAGLATAANSILTTNASGDPSWSVLSGDVYSQYALLAGRAGGQTLKGGTLSSQDLTLDSTSHATKGNIILNPTGGNVGIGTAAPGAKLDVKGEIRMSGATSGYTGFKPAAVAGTTVWTLPVADGTLGQVLSTNGSGDLTWATSSGADNLGNHTATQNLDLATFKLVGNGGSAGLSIDSAGKIGVGTSTYSGTLSVQTSSAATIGHTIRATASQSADMFQIQDSSGTPRFAINLGSATVSGTGHTNLGVGAGVALTSALNATYVGYNAGNANTTGGFNTGIGNSALKSAVDAQANTAVGDSALRDTVSSVNNTAVGAGAMKQHTTGDNNVAVGTNSLGAISTSDNNTALGDYSLRNLTSGGNNLAVGQNSGAVLTTGANNTFIGSGSGSTSTGSGNVFLGYNAGASELGSNKLYIANTNTATPLIYGDFSTGSVGIGTTSPSYALQVSGDISISGNYKVNGVNIGSGTVGSVTAATTTGNPITVSSSTTSPSIDITRATASVNGYLASSDFTTFNNKLSQALNSGSIFVGDVSNIATAQVLSGDAAIDNAGILTLVNNSVTGAKILDSTITSADLTSSVANALWSVNGSGDVSRTTGNVGIGNTTPAKLLHVGSASVGTGLAVANFQNVDGTCTITPASSGSGIACSSDERLKENFQDVTGSFALDRILQLQAVTYNFKTSSTDNRRTGYKAQEVQKVAPEFVRENEDGLLQVYYDAFIPWITEAIKTLYSRITGVENHQASQDRQIASKADKTEVDQLKAENAKLKADAEKQKQENAAMKARLDKIEKMLKSK